MGMYRDPPRNFLVPISPVAPRASPPWCSDTLSPIRRHRRTCGGLQEVQTGGSSDFWTSMHTYPQSPAVPTNVGTDAGLATKFASDVDGSELRLVLPPLVDG